MTITPIEPLRGFTCVTLATNVPGPVAAARLSLLGARIVKVEPPGGDPLAEANRPWYGHLVAGQEIIRLDLKNPSDSTRLFDLCGSADLLLTSSRPAALERLGLSWESLHQRYPRLCQVAIIGYPPPRENVPGHDLTYLAEVGLLAPPQLPRTLLADLAGAERAVSAALQLLLARERGVGASYAWVSLSAAAADFAAPWQFGITAPGALLGGGFAGYGLYPTADGWLAVGALEPHFWTRLRQELSLSEGTHDALARVLATRPAEDWEAWAAARDLPLHAVRDAS